jgi:hypothetical protein
MQNNAIKFTSYEREIMRDFAFLVAKRSVMQKVELIWGELMDGILSHPDLTSAIEERYRFSFESAKISKGENYLGLPYIVLDGPRYFSGDDIVTYRSMFWWSNFFSFTLLVQGTPWQSLKTSCDFQTLPSDTYASLAETPWVHHFDEGNAILLSELLEEEREQELLDHSFLKLSRKLDIDADEEKIVEYGLETWEMFSTFLTGRY